MKRIPTVAVDRDGAKVIINESDFDEKQDRLWKDPNPAPKKDDKGGGKDPSTVTPNIRVEPVGGGWFNVLVGDEVVNEKSLREDEAHQLAKKLASEADKPADD